MHLGINGDHVAAVEFDRRKVRNILGLRDCAQFHKGKPITTMSYDWYANRRAHRFDGTRFTLQEILLSQLTNFLYDDGRGDLERPGVVRAAEEAFDLEMVGPHRAPRHGRGHQ